MDKETYLQNIDMCLFHAQGLELPIGNTSVLEFILGGPVEKKVLADLRDQIAIPRGPFEKRTLLETIQAFLLDHWDSLDQAGAFFRQFDSRELGDQEENLFFLWLGQEGTLLPFSMEIDAIGDLYKSQGDGQNHKILCIIQSH